MQRSVTILALSLFVAVLAGALASPAAALSLEHETSISLKGSDRVFGSMRGNILVYSKPTITLYNNRLKPIFSRRLKNNVKPVMSPNGKHLGLITYADRSPTDMRTIKFERFDAAGKFMWKLDNPPANAFVFADNGGFYGIEGVKGIPPVRIHVYDEYGERVNIINLSAYHGLLPAPSGKKFLIDKAINGIDVYDSLGNRLASLPKARNYVFDKDDRYLGTFFEGVFRLYQDEKLIREIDSEEQVIKDMAIDIENDRLVLMAINNVEVIELTTGKILWNYQFLDELRVMTQLDMSDDAEFFVCGLDINEGANVPKGKRHIQGQLMLFPINGKTMYRQSVKYEEWGIDMPRGFFSSSGAAVYLLTQEKLIKYRLR